jgi:hypothetical protein
VSLAGVVTITSGDLPRDQTCSSASDDSTQLLHYAAYASSVPLAISSTSSFPPLQPAPSSSPGGAPSPAPLSGLLTLVSVWGKYVTDETLTLNPDYK